MTITEVGLSPLKVVSHRCGCGSFKKVVFQTLPPPFFSLSISSDFFRLFLSLLRKKIQNGSKAYLVVRCGRALMCVV